MAELLALVGPVMSGQSIIRLSTQLSAASKRVSANVIVLQSSSVAIRHEILAHVDELTERLVRRGHHGLTEQACDAWASLLDDAGTVASEAQLRAATLAMSYALEYKRLPLSSLVMIAFPIVHAHLQSKKHTPSLMDAFFVLPLSILGEYDRAKNLRQNLVTTFMKSSWPPARLLVAAMNAKVESKILKQVAKESGGRGYLQAMRRDLPGLSSADKSRAAKAFNMFYNRLET